MLLCAFNAMCWSLPLRFKNFAASEKVLGIGSTFSGGVFLALAFGHMIPEAVESFAGGGSGMAAAAATKMACAFTLAGYLLIWAVDRAASGATSELTATAAGASSSSAAAAAPPARGGSATVLLGALSLHSILETMALAVARSKPAAGLLAISIAVHQPAESVAILVALLRAGFSGRRLWRFLLTFTAMGPLGAVLGLGLHRWFAGSAAAGALDGALVALTAGTFVYVGATEVLPEEFDEENIKIAPRAKIVAFFTGIVAIFGLAHVAELIEAAAGA